MKISSTFYALSIFIALFSCQDTKEEKDDGFGTVPSTEMISRND